MRRACLPIHSEITIRNAYVAWDAYQINNISNLEKCKKAARFVKHDYSKHNSVARMIRELDWKNLQDRRKDRRLTILYKIINEIANVPNKNIIILADTRR